VRTATHPDKDSNIGHFCEYCDNDRNPNKEDLTTKTQKHNIFVRTTIMITVLYIVQFVRTVIMIAVLRNSCDHFMKTLIIVAVIRNKVFL